MDEETKKALENLEKRVVRLESLLQAEPESFKEKKIFLKEFIAEKMPTEAIQTSVVLAYYLYKFEKKEAFNEEDLRKVWIESGRKPPKNIWQSAIDAKNKKGWFDESSRGVYKLSPRGIYFVENELPKKKS